MIFIEFNPPDDDEWRGWLAKCEGEQDLHDRATEAWLSKWAREPRPLDRAAEKARRAEKPKVKGEVYKGRKEQVFMLREGPFRGKCAYCEISIYEGQHGDIEHFRPKGAVIDPGGDPVKVLIDGSEEEHPGYYWLAYDWTNMLPSCQLCNQPNTQRSGGLPVGKRDYFPLEPGSPRAAAPGEEAHERPLLINPTLEDPADHLKVDKSGVLAARTPRGQACIDVLGLNLRDLPNARKKTYSDAKKLVKAWMGELLEDKHGGRTRELSEELFSVISGQQPHTMMALLAAEESLEPVMQVSDIIPLLRRLGHIP